MEWLSGPGLEMNRPSPARLVGSVLRPRKKNSPPNADEDFIDTDKLKMRFKSAWNNVRYGWSMKRHAEFRKNSSIWMLGKLYHTLSFEDLERLDNPEMLTFEDFLADFTSRIWLTYRSGFQELSGSDYRTDCGWGCMLRSGQMLLAQAITLCILGQDWSMFKPQSYEGYRCHREILSLFRDSPTSPFSLHTLVDLGQALGRKAGDWYGPGTTAHLIKRAVAKANDAGVLKFDLAVYVSQDCTLSLACVNKLGCAEKPESLDPAQNQSTVADCSPVNPCPPSPFVMDQDDSQENGVLAPDPATSGRRYSFLEIAVPATTLNATEASPTLHGGLPSYEDACKPPPSESTAEDAWLRSVLMLFPLRLGSEKLNPMYIPGLKLALSLPYCVGIMGGKPKHSLYFLGWHENSVIYLDPHYCQDSGLGGAAEEHASLKTFHCQWPKKVSFENMDPSCAIGFLIRSQDELQSFLRESLPLYQSRYPLFSVIEDYAAMVENHSAAELISREVTSTPSNNNSASQIISQNTSGFEVL